MAGFGWLLALTLPVAGAPTELTRDAEWQYRGTNAAPLAAEWPKVWTTFTPWDYETGASSSNDNPCAFACAPTNLTLNGISACRATLPLYPRDVLDLTVGQGAPGTQRWAYAFADLRSDREQDVSLRIRACGPLTAWMNGKQVLVAREAGPYSFSAHLKAGTNVVAARVTSGADEWTLAGGVDPAPDAEARCAFTVADPTQYVSLVLVAPDADTAQLNGQPLPAQIPGMNCGEIVVPATLLRPGRNVLRQTAAPGGRLLGLHAEDAAIDWGPFCTAVTATSGVIVCRANARVQATLRLAGRELRSPAGTLHRWSMDGLKPGVAYPYTVIPGLGAARNAILRTLPDSGPVTIGFAGDPQSRLGWQEVSQAVKRRKPDVLVLIGDLVNDGYDDALWTQTFFAPGAELLASVPILAVLGNHDRRSPAFMRLFADNQGGLNGSQVMGNALLVWIDGGLDWSPAGTNANWLEGVLAANRKPFVFVATHYACYSSRNHGKILEDGRLVERASRVSRMQILPILEKHRVTAMLSGHDHGYERSELPSGMTVIVTAGAGAGFYKRLNNAHLANPYSRVFVQKHHFSTVQVEGNRAVFTAATADGEVIDTRTWTVPVRP